MNDKIEKKDLPENVIEIFSKKFDNYPCITKTRNVTSSAIDLLTKKNKILWYISYCDETSTQKIEGVILYSEVNKILIYFKKVELENVYNIKIMSEVDSEMSVSLLVKGLNKSFTIDFV